MMSARDNDQDGAMEQRITLVERLQELRGQAEEVQRRLDAIAEQRAVVNEERLCLTAEYRALIQDGSPQHWARQALQQEQVLLRSLSALGHEWLRLVDEQRRLRQERVALLDEQADLLCRAPQ